MKLCPFCLRPYADIYTVVYDQCFFDVAFCHVEKPEDGAIAEGLFCGIDMEGVWSIGIRPSDLTVHVLKNTIISTK